MSAAIAFIWLLAINVTLVVGDWLAKRAVGSSTRDMGLTFGALALWFGACCMWLPVMRARGFTKLIGLADAIGLTMVALVGYFGLGERLSIREWAGVGFALVAMALLG